jgi:hypothetical protein
MVRKRSKARFCVGGLPAGDFVRDVMLRGGRWRDRYGYGTCFSGLRICAAADCEQKKNRNQQRVFSQISH